MKKWHSLIMLMKTYKASELTTYEIFCIEGTSYLLRGDSMAIPCCGVVSGFSFGAAASGDVTAQIWKPVGGDTYEVVGETLFSGNIYMLLFFFK
jgi:hypothetical protein